MAKPARYFLQGLAYAVFAVIIGYFSFWPRYHYAAADVGILKVSLSHAAARIEPCVRLNPEQIAELAPNMRQTLQCERERLPLLFQLQIEGETVLDIAARPSGLWNDGPASIYERVPLDPGNYSVTASLRDSAREDGWDYTYRGRMVVEAGHYNTLTFRPETGGFSLR